MECIVVTRNEHYCIAFIETRSNQEKRSIMATSVHTDQETVSNNKKAQGKKTYEHASIEIASLREGHLSIHVDNVKLRTGSRRTGVRVGSR